MRTMSRQNMGADSSLARVRRAEVSHTIPAQSCAMALRSIERSRATRRLA